MECLTTREAPISGVAFGGSARKVNINMQSEPDYLWSSKMMAFPDSKLHLGLLKHEHIVPPQGYQKDGRQWWSLI